MSDYTDDFVHFVTVSPPPMEREDQKDPFLSIDQSISLGHPHFAHHADFAHLQNGTNTSNLDGVHTFGGLHHLNDSQYSGDGLQALQNPQSLNSVHSLSSPSNLHSPQNFPSSLQSPQNLPQNIQNIQNLRNVSQTPASGTELESSLVSPNSASSHDRNALNRFHTDPNHSGFDSNSFLFSNPTPISSSNLLAPSQFGLLGGGSATSSYANSAYSEVSSSAQVPYQDAASHFSAASANYAAALEPKDSYFEPLPTQLRARDSFNQEISLGQSISTTNLMQMTSPYDSPVAPDPKFSHSPTVPRDVYGQSYSDIGQQSFQLTENNLSSYNDIENKVTISIQEAPEVVARKTPSLFSNSSHNSSNAPGQGHHSNSAQPHLQRPDYYPSVPSSPSGASPAYSLNSPLDASGSDSQFLNPEDFQNIKRGRQSAHSRKVHSRSNSRSRSRSRDPGNYSGAETSDYDSDYDGEKEQSLKAMSAREKMLELANAPVVTKRTQIHPSLYACNLCEKRFTRPYNLKSHLRTHTDERPYICNVCGKAFARQHDKKRHEELHSGEKKFQCKGVLRDGTEFGCSRKFARADALRRHFQTEAGKECIRLLVEEEQASQNQNQPQNVNSGIQLPDGKFMNSYFSDVPMVSIQSPETGYD